MTGETVKPDSVNILGKIYQITYCDKPSDVDVFRRESIWELDIKSIDSKDDDGHDQLDRLALALADFLNRNKWLKIDVTGDNRSDSKIR
jgi:hypothetical protein